MGRQKSVDEGMQCSWRLFRRFAFAAGRRSSGRNNVTEMFVALRLSPANIYDHPFGDHFQSVTQAWSQRILLARGHRNREVPLKEDSAPTGVRYSDTVHVIKAQKQEVNVSKSVARLHSGAP